MIEDKSFNEFLKAKLEEDVVDIPRVDFPDSPTSNFPTFGFRTFRFLNFSTCLLAASLLLVGGMFAVHFINDRELVRERDALGAIELLDVDSMTASCESYADRLLAWQDAPYAEIANY